MSDPERIYEQASELIRRASTELQQLAKRGERRGRRLLARLLKAAALMLLSTLVIIVGMVSTGLLFGPRGVEGLIAAPIALFVAWTAILYWALAAKPTPRAVVTANLAQLPARTEEWLERQRKTLPAGAQVQLDALLLRLEALTPQVQALDPQSPSAHEIRRLLGEELLELVHSYQKVPPALQRQALPGGHSPDRQLADGLATIDEAIGRLHERLAADDLRALATQQRYLESKYKRDGKLD